jgi:Kdo2-lipid IVA lauroyltransferase/acyltransferase
VKHAPIRHRLEYGAYLTLKGVVRALPHRASRTLGAAIGRLAHRLDGRHRRLAAENLALAFPELTAKERRDTVAACFRHFGAALCDFISADRFGPVEICRRFTYEGWDNLERAEALGRGVFLLGAHHGQWEISGKPIALYRGPMYTIARPADNPHLERELSGLRQRLGYSVIHKHGAARRMLQVLRERGRIGILPDQRVHEREGIVVPFFGHPALTTPILARLSRRHGTPVVPVFAYPEPGGRYHLVVRPAILPDATDENDGVDAVDEVDKGEGGSEENEGNAGDAAAADGAELSGGKAPSGGGGELAARAAHKAAEAAAVTALTRRYLAVIEDEIRAHRHMWLWMHRRWSPRPRPTTPG